MALLDEVATYLIAQGVAAAGSTADYVVGRGYEPNQPDRIFALYETGGYPRDSLSTGTIEQPTFQLRVRGAPWSVSQAGYSSARAKLETAKTKLEAVLNTSIGSAAWKYLHIRSLHPVLDLGRDVNDRPNLALNFATMRSRTS